MMEKLSTLYGSPSISTVRPFLISDVLIATLRDVLDAVFVLGKHDGAKATADADRIARRVVLKIILEEI
jgi:hypothetical protein